ncbi:glycosyltransferase family 1 protein [Bradyrhizobium sp. dw_78]|uniref:glycosyltransferase family 4 protein n=1 Tax=Bradyrhizobium sp. dw_78 TaxID=2719793 RepID=UPI001BD52056|nr:glycosyltransferase family 1 protein [Bradyrhizobium sp. dw_78]
MSPVPSFGVNGRFLTQPVTGVQRYARNVLTAMNAALSDLSASTPIIAPPSAPDPVLSAMPLVSAGPLAGHCWEQIVLPTRWRGRLLNLCNTAPVAKADQVVCIHDANIFVAPESYGTAFRTVYRTLQPLLARRAARITTVSADSARQIARYLPVRAEDIVVLPDGHEHALAWNPALARIGPSVITEGREHSERGFVLALGSHARHKNLPLLLKIAPELAEMGLDIVVAGGGAGIFAAEILASAPNVRMIGYVTDHDLAYLMERTLCLLFPSWTEGFGLPIVEAMARGCPVVSSDRASMPEVCGDAALMAPPDNPAAWVDHVRALARSRDLRQNLIGRGREQVRLFSWANTAAGYLELMREPKTRLASRHAGDQPLPTVAVVIATLGRPQIVTATVKHLLETQTLKPATVIVSCVVREDAGEAANLPVVTVVTGRPGLPAQRNTALAALPAGIDVVVFFDDDFVADADWLAVAAKTFRDEPQVVAFTGHVLADDIKGPGLSFDDALRILSTADRSTSWSRLEPYSPYGCNMAFRLSAIGDLKFDERLVLYGWLEDRDFSAALAKRGGQSIKCAAACGVHMGVKSGRVSGDRLGYSQIVNPIYMLRKGTMSSGRVSGQLLRNIASNVWGSVRPEPFIDRRGRLRGNLRGLADVVRGRVEPERAMAIRSAPRDKTASCTGVVSQPDSRSDGTAAS